jgi:hypothetical protein
MTNDNHRKLPRSSKPLAPHISSPVDRRKFLKSSAGSLSALSALSYARAADTPSEKVTLAIIGIGPAKSESIINGRGRQLLGLFASFNDVEIASICDPDENLFPSAQISPSGIAARRRSKKTFAAFCKIKPSMR